MCIGYVMWVTIPRMRTTLIYISGILPVVALTIVSILNIIRLVARLIGDMTCDITRDNCSQYMKLTNWKKAQNKAA